MIFDRDDSLEILQSQGKPFDLLIIGGGATGLGCAVDAAARGHRVALLEQADFAKGTSSRSTKLVHGGVRYLKQGNISLVRDALKERGLLRANAPHLVRAMDFIIPAYSWLDKPFYGVGMKMYDFLAGSLNLKPSRTLSKAETMSLLPNIEPASLRGGVMYCDGQFDDARLAINLAQTASEQGAVLANYTRVVGLVKEGGRIAGVEVEDIESGRQFVIKAKVVVNATGVFVDELRKADDRAAAPIVAVSQGVHLVLPRRFLPSKSALMVPKTDDGRVLFAVPWHDHVVVGTTDTPVGPPALEPRALDEEKEFILSHAAQYFANDPTAADVLSVYVGLRPLIKVSGTEKTATLSRDHTILISPSSLLTVSGGKWTTYRKMAEEVVDKAEKLGSLPARNCVTQSLRIHGYVSDAGPEMDVYGSDRQAIDTFVNETAGYGDLLHESFSHSAGEVVWQIRHEMARTVEDVLARRTRMLFLDARASVQAAPKVAALLAGELKRDKSWQEAQVAAFSVLASGYLFD